jgi:hypothetical protein
MLLTCSDVFLWIWTDIFKALVDRWMLRLAEATGRGSVANGVAPILSGWAGRTHPSHLALIFSACVRMAGSDSVLYPPSSPVRLTGLPTIHPESHRGHWRYGYIRGEVRAHVLGMCPMHASETELAR